MGIKKGGQMVAFFYPGWLLLRLGQNCVFLPASAQGGEEFHGGQLTGQACGQEVLTGREQGALGVVQGEEIGRASCRERV